MIYCFDIDGTVCTDTEGNYNEAVPFPGVVDRLNALVSMGHTVYMFTARGATTGVNWRDITENQLRKWGINHHGLYFTKPSADIYVDDKAINASDWNLNPIYSGSLDGGKLITRFSGVSCYLCGSEELTIISREIRDGLSEVFYCPTCDIGMLDWQRDRHMQEYYNLEYRERHAPDIDRPGDYSAIFQSQVNFQESKLRFLRSHLSKTKSVLEVGCSTGLLLYHVNKLVGEAVGVDLDERAVAFAAKQCGCKTYCGDFSQIGLETGYFDIVYSMQTLEHTQDPVAFMCQLKKFVKKDGLIFIEVPNLRDPLVFVYENENYKKFYYHEAHIFYFTAKSLLEVMDRASIKGEIEFVQDYNFLNHVHWQSAKKPQRSCVEGLGPNRLKISGKLSKKFRAEFDKINERFDDEYKRLLARYEFTDNLIFIGRPSKV